MLIYFLSLLDSPVRPTPSQYCQSTESLGVMWPRIKVGEVVERPCPEDKLGMMSWKCTGAGWRGRFPDTSNCVSPWLNSIDQLVSQRDFRYIDLASKLFCNIFKTIMFQIIYDHKIIITIVRLIHVLLTFYELSFS